jgi:sortase (surface protein transpeptidase)
MDKDSVQSTETPTTLRRYSTVATVVVFVVVMLVGIALMYSPRFAADQVLAPVEEATGIVEGPVLLESAPVRLRIPSINLDTDFEAPLGLKENGEIEVPDGYESVAYYKNGPTPGELGPSVILGHVDSYEGPAVFFGIGQLKEGDEIEVEREDGTVAVFAVTSLERHAQSGFPTAKVYGDLNHAGLRLITCSGFYDKDALRYTHNLIVFAKLVSTSTVNQE